MMDTKVWCFYDFPFFFLIKNADTLKGTKIDSDVVSEKTTIQNKIIQTNYLKIYKTQSILILQEKQLGCWSSTYATNK